MAKKSVISGLARPEGFADDVARELAKLSAPVAKKVGSQFARTATKKRAMAKTSRMAKKHMDVMKKSGKRWDGRK